MHSLTSGFLPPPSEPAELHDVRFYGMRAFEEDGQLWVSVADTKPFSTVSLQVTEVGTFNIATFDLGTPGAIQTSANGWYVASIPIDFVPTNLEDLEIELIPVIHNVGSSITKRYVRRFAWE